MKTYFKFVLIITLTLITGCQNKKNDFVENKKKINTMTNDKDDRLKDGINISSSFIEDLEFNKYKYNNEYIEQIRLSSLEDQKFRNEFFKYLASRNLDQNQNEQVFLIKLLLVRIQQVDDLESYNLLSLIFNDKNLSYYLEDYELELFQLFLYKPYFFTKGEYRYKQGGLIDYINQNLPPALLTNRKYFENNIVDIHFQENTLLINKDVVDGFSIQDLKIKIEQEANKIEGYFSPSYENSWKNKTVIYYNLYDYLNDAVANRSDKNELLVFNTKYKPFFKNYIIKGFKNLSTIQDIDGYTNLRKEKNASSEILQKVNSGENIEVLDNTGDWYLVKTKGGKEGYVHKSRVKN